jgi:nucleoside-diphosphate-sugar epimerase
MYEKVKELGFIPYVGDGSSIFNSLHVKDVARFVSLILAQALKEEVQGSVYERCFLIGGAEVQWKSVARAFANVFHSKGVISDPEAKSVALNEAGRGEIPMLMASDMRFVGPRAKRLGFQATEATLLAYLETNEDGFPAV